MLLNFSLFFPLLVCLLLWEGCSAKNLEGGRENYFSFPTQCDSVVQRSCSHTRRGGAWDGQGPPLATPGCREPHAFSCVCCAGGTISTVL